MTIITETDSVPTAPLDRAQAFLNAGGRLAGNFQLIRVPSMVTINRMQWSQVAGTMNDEVMKSTRDTDYVIATLFPSDSTRLVMIEYTASTDLFDQVNAQDFQLMLLSFKFT